MSGIDTWITPRIELVVIRVTLVHIVSHQIMDNLLLKFRSLCKVFSSLHVNLVHQSSSRISRIGQWIHTNSVVNVEKASLSRGRSKTLRKRPKLPDNFLSTHYFKNSSIIQSTSDYDAFIDNNLWKELEWAGQLSLAPKGSMAGLNHTDHLELIIPHPGACHFQIIWLDA
ncbi:unnamed protein product [Rhizopus stolonifer]